MLVKEPSRSRLTAATIAVLSLALQPWAAVAPVRLAAAPALEICTSDGIVHLDPQGGTGGPAPQHRHCDLCTVGSVAAPLPTAPPIARLAYTIRASRAGPTPPAVRYRAITRPQGRAPPVA